MDAIEQLKHSPKIHTTDIQYSEEDTQNGIHGLQGSADTSQDMVYIDTDNKEDVELEISKYKSNDSECSSQKDGDINVKSRKRRTMNEVEKLQIYSSQVFKEEFDGFNERGKRIRVPPKPQPNLSSRTKKQAVKKKVNPEDEVAFPCTRCPKEFNSKTGLLNHLRMHQTVRKFTCAICYATFDTNALLIAHKDVHVEEKRSYFCGQCKLAFTDHCDFLIHGISHTHRKFYKCVECGAFYNKNGYKAHAPTHYNRKKQCPICLVYYKETSINWHIKSHSVAAACVECGKTFSEPKRLEQHMYIHTGLTPYQCLYCGKGFSNNAKRRVHTRIHTEERPYNCDLCEKTFIQYTDMKRHRESHEKLKRFQCDHCKKKFMHKLDLRSHIRSHMKEDLYVCPECKASFTTVPGLKTHILYKHTTERPVRCDVCDTGFINNNQYQKHCRSKYHKRNIYGLSLKKET